MAWISTAPVKGLALEGRRSVLLGRSGAPENRRFLLLDERGTLVNGKRAGHLAQVRATYDADGEQLVLSFPDGSSVGGAATPRHGTPLITVSFDRRKVIGRPLAASFDAALSAFARRSLRLVRAEEDGAGVDRGSGASVSLVGEASLERLGAELGLDGPADARRFRMLLGVAGTQPHEEDAWVGHVVEIGAALVRLHGLVGRCVVTTQSPATGQADLDTLGALRRYRPPGPGGPPFGVYGEVLVPGVVCVGDPVTAR